MIATGVTTTSYATQITGTASYYYKVVAVNSGGQSADSVSVRATGTSPAPTNLTVSALSRSLKLTWKDNSANESGFLLEYWTGSTWAQFGATGANTTSVTVSGLATGWTYYFRVRAYNGSTYTGYSNTGSGIPL